MTNVSEFVISETLGWLLAYSFAFGLLLLPVVYLVKFFSRRAQPQLRYGVGLVLLSVIVTLPVVAAILLVNRSNISPAVGPEMTSSVPSDFAVPAQVTAIQPAAGISSEAGDQFIAWLPLFWLAGATATSLFVGLGVLGTRRLVRNGLPLRDCLRVHTEEICRDFPAFKRVIVLISDQVVSPVLVGIFKPAILLPATANGWDSETFKFVLLHEFAHVRRYDNLVNFIQRLLEVVFFYQPAVWLVSHGLRAEREVCCDNFVVAQTRRPKAYAQTLLQLAEQKAVSFNQLAMSSLAAKSIGFRIRRLLRKEEPMKFSIVWLLVASVSVLGVTSGITAQTVAKDEVSSPAAEQSAKPELEDKKTATAAEPVKSKPESLDPEAGTVVGKKLLEASHCRIQVSNESDIKTEVAGRISEIHVKVGERVKRGQVIAKMDSSVFEAELKELEHKARSTVLTQFAQLTVRQNEQRLNEMKKLIKQAPNAGVLAPNEIREQEFAIEKAKAELKKTMEDTELLRLNLQTKRLQLKQYTLRAPMDGIVTELHATVGNSMSAYSNVISMEDLQTIELICSVPELEIPNLKVGTRVQFTPAVNIGSDAIFGVVARVGSVADSFRIPRVPVFCRMKNPGEHVREGTRGTAVFFESNVVPSNKLPGSKPSSSLPKPVSPESN